MARTLFLPALAARLLASAAARASAAMLRLWTALSGAVLAARLVRGGGSYAALAVADGADT